MSSNDPQAGPAGHPHPYPASYAFPAPEYPPPPGPGGPPPARTRRTLLGIGGAALAVALVVSGVGIGRATDSTGGSGVVAAVPSIGGSDTGNDEAPDSGQGYFPNGLGQGTGGTQGSGTPATSSQQAGIVTIVSVLKYQNAESAGTGMILTGDGEILTNNHVINGATSVTVTDEASGRSYKADVVGTDPSDDVAVLQLRGASGLTTAKMGDASDVADLAVGASVTGVGNAGGTGTLSAAAGKVTALEQTITASDEGGAGSETLHGLIETDAGIVSGDSGGPLYDAGGTIVGIDTAAAATNGTQTASRAYAIPIDDALRLADRIESGAETSSIHIGRPAFIGVGVSDSATGAGITSVLSGGPADDAGITAGSVITAVGGKSVTSAASLKSRMASYEPGQKLTVTWTDGAGARHSATMTAVSGPAD